MGQLTHLTLVRQDGKTVGPVCVQCLIEWAAENLGVMTEEK